MGKAGEIRETVIKAFTGASIQDSYKELTRKGLWNSEELLFGKYFKKGSRILDIGCGSGRTTFPLIKKGHEVTAIDITPDMIKSAEEMAEEFGIKADFRTGDAANLEFEDSSFDNAVFSFNGWNHIAGKENRISALKEVFRVLKPEGYFIFTSHIRKLKDLILDVWIKSSLSINILRPLGIKIREMEYGDVFFKKTASGLEHYKSENYMHIPKLSEIKEMIKKSGFKLVFNEYRDNIAPIDEEQRTGNSMFFVCNKKV